MYFVYILVGSTGTVNVLDGLINTVQYTAQPIIYRI
jgi:hypothetical protein